MMKSITRTMLTSTMGFAWDLIKTGERIVAFAERRGATDERAGFAELFVRKAGKIITSVGGHLEPGVNKVAVWLGYSDGDVSGMVAWPVPAH